MRDRSPIISRPSCPILNVLEFRVIRVEAKEEAQIKTLEIEKNLQTQLSLKDKEIEDLNRLILQSKEVINKKIEEGEQEKLQLQKELEQLLEKYEAAKQKHEETHKA